MSELVEKVCDALNDASGGDCDPKIFEGDARAAIKAVADFLHQEDDEYSDDSSLYRAAVFLRSRLNEDKP